MKYILPLFFVLLTTVCPAQKYALLDERLIHPVTFTNTVTIQQDYDGMFAVEKNNLKAFIAELEKISKQLSTTGAKFETTNLNIGSTKFIMLKVPLKSEERLDVMIVTDCGTVKTSLHLCDATNSNASNAYFINTWLKYIHSHVK